MRLLLTATVLLLSVPAASAKEFRPGDLLVCGATQCRVINDVATTRAFGEFLYGSRPISRAAAPRIGSAVFQLRTKDGPMGVVYTKTAARVHGLNCGRFQRGKWYRLPPSLRGLATGLKPKR